MSLDIASFLLHTPESEKTTVFIHIDEETVIPYEALLVAQTRFRKLFITLEPKRRYLTHTQLPDEEQPEIDFLQEYEEVEALLEDAGLDGIHDGEQGILYHNLLYLLMNP
ncbi:hypothetical protein HMJ29_00455 [Hymenobacter taeanensis]|uniref:Uncharacterized protein n=1 Tax=Hymenobacter taeanensis TaxID=2735321 RepID=A0A6M6BCF9_9BACT|nr:MULTISPECIES: hypothetical protein [Hymenobacter]QJX45488.1 hypothetical protein HMJ29_00455 [Hymenobacter taeanensis]UOQ81265.1 hypothetical protein MUN83_00240 [Hymenobacter sp. 5414T-23]